MLAYLIDFYSNTDWSPAMHCEQALSQDCEIKQGKICFQRADNLYIHIHFFTLSKKWIFTKKVNVSERHVDSEGKKIT